MQKNLTLLFVSKWDVQLTVFRKEFIMFFISSFSKYGQKVVPLSVR